MGTNPSRIIRSNDFIASDSVIGILASRGRVRRLSATAGLIYSPAERGTGSMDSRRCRSSHEEREREKKKERKKEKGKREEEKPGSTTDLLAYIRRAVWLIAAWTVVNFSGVTWRNGSRHAKSSRAPHNWYSSERGLEILIGQEVAIFLFSKQRLREFFLDSEVRARFYRHGWHKFRRYIYIY